MGLNKPILGLTSNVEWNKILIRWIIVENSGKTLEKSE